MRSDHHPRELGLTIIELMIAIAIVGILATMAGWQGQELLRRQQHQDLARGTYAAVNRARMGAVSSGKPGVITFGAARLTVFVDQSSPSNWVYDPGVDKLLATFPEDNPADPNDDYPDGVTLNSTFPSIVDGRRTAIFNSDGFSVDTGGIIVSGEVTYTDALLNGRSLTVKVSAGGAARIL